MLPDFPSIRRRRIERLQFLAYAASLKQNGLLAQLRAHRQPEGKTVKMYDVEGGVAMDSYEEFSASTEFDLTDMRSLTDDVLLAKLKSITDKMIDDQMRLLLRRVSEAATSTGNVVNAKGPLSADHILEVLQNTQLDFENGRVAPGFAFVAAPETAKRLAELQTSDEQDRRHRQIIEDKYLDWRLRTASRRLVD